MLAIGLSANAAAADRAGDLKVTQRPDGNTTVRVSSDGSVPQPSRRGGSTVQCHYYETFYENYDHTNFIPAGQLTPEAWYWAHCVDSADGANTARYFQYTPGEPPISALGLALAAQATLVLPYPDVRTNPSIGQDQLVGIDTWLWVDPAAWQPLTASASIPELSATVTATPTRVVWTMGDGQPPVVCNGPGTPYDTSIPEAAQSTDCSHLYQDRGDYTGAATIEYLVSWSASNGEGGTLEPASRTTEFPMPVAERQAIGA